MSLIEQALISAIKKLPKTPIVIAYSGGVDSQVLLHALATLSHNQVIVNPITVCHVNHGLSNNAHSWQSFAEQQCAKHNLPLVIKQVTINIQTQQSLEALARDARYQALSSIYQESSLIITGHHSDDQSETFLLALKRGAGLKGLSAMALDSTLAHHQLLRPFLSISRQKIEEYASEHQLNWIEDESNTDTSFDRNFLRQDIMPLLTSRWPSIQNTINRSAQHCREGQQLLDELAEDDLLRCQETTTSLNVSLLTELSLARFNNLIRYFLAKSGCLMPSTEQLIQVRQQLFASSDKTPEIKVADHYLRRFKGQLYVTDVLEDVSAWQRELSSLSALVHEQNISEQLVLPDHIGMLCFDIIEGIEVSTSQNKTLQQLALPNAKQKVTIKFSHQNPRCLPHYRQHSRPLKKVLQELEIPPWQRTRVPFLYYGEKLVAAIGYFVCQGYVAKKNEKCLQVLIKKTL